jgi:DNA-binding transcriptional regulator GbsR (MarR family)
MSALATSTPEQFVESAGILLEEMGLPRMAGRVIGWLLICDPPHQSAAQLATALTASAGSVSSSTRLLVGYGLINRVAFAGDRRDYFVMRPGLWWSLMRQRLRDLHAFRELADAARERLPGASANERLEEVSVFYELLETALEESLGRFEAGRGGQAR